MSHENIVCHPEEVPRFYDDTKTLAHRSFNPALRKNIKKHPHGCFFLMAESQGFEPREELTPLV